MAEAIVVRFEDPYAAVIRSIRNTVFAREQHIAQEIDFDGQDPDAIHVLVVCQGKYAGTGRMLRDGHIGRLAVLKEYRGRGLGATAVRTLVKEAEKGGLSRIYLGAQEQAVGFYETLGFSVCGKPYLEANIRHCPMERLVPLAHTRIGAALWSGSADCTLGETACLEPE